MSDWTKENEWFDFKVIVCLLKYIHKNLCVCAQSCLTPCDPMTIACQALLSMECSRQEYWSGLPFPASGDLLDPAIEPTSPQSPALTGEFFTSEPPGKTYQAGIVDWKKMHNLQVENCVLFGALWGLKPWRKPLRLPRGGTRRHRSF